MPLPLRFLFVAAGLIVVARDARDWLRAARSGGPMTGVVDARDERSGVERALGARGVRLFLFHPTMIVFGSWLMLQGATT